jgi:hypothetical protein
MRTVPASLAAVLLALGAAACAGRPAPVAGAALAWIEDDAPRALDQAKRQGVPIFVEAWAPW